jgi:dethiobiotin synthetase
VRAVTSLLVTGTNTAVGKTIATAAIAATATAAGLRVFVLKPGETGFPPGSTEESDVDRVLRLAGPAGGRTLASYPDPLAPLAAAEESGIEPLALGDVIEAVSQAEAEYDLVLIEGAGGLLVPMGEGRWNVGDLAMALRCPAVVVARAGLGTINHTALTLEALDRRGIPSYLVIGSWPAQPVLVHWRNLADLPGELVGVVPEGVGELDPARFRAAAPGWLSAKLYGEARPERLRNDGVAGPPPDWPELMDRA